MQAVSNFLSSAGQWLSTHVIPDRGEPLLGYPKRKDKDEGVAWRYMPWISAGCFAFMLLGVGLWVHYTTVSYSYSNYALRILGIDLLKIYNPVNVKIVDSTLTASSVIFTIFGMCIVVVGTWRGWQALDQDLNGRVYDQETGLTLFCIVLLQGVWWIVMLWIVIVMMFDAIFLTLIYTVRGGVYASLLAQRNTPASVWTPSSNQNPYTCPATCYSANSQPFFGLLNSNGIFQRGGCICDNATLLDAYNALVTAYNGMSGMLVGIFIMFIFGSFLSYYLSSMWSRTKTEIDLFQRVASA